MIIFKLQPGAKAISQTIDNMMIYEACMSFRHDFGLLSKEEREPVMLQAKYWLEAWQKQGLKLHKPEPVNGTQLNLSCPWCNKEPQRIQCLDTEHWQFGCTNSDCSVRPCTRIYIAESTATDAWNNQRHQIADNSEQIQIADIINALSPFKKFSDDVDDIGWTGTIQKERICNWFGSSDFITILTLLTKAENQSQLNTGSPTCEVERTKQLENDIKELKTKFASAVRFKSFTIDWYGSRLEAILAVSERAGIVEEVKAIIANGCGSRLLPDGTYFIDPPTYAQRLNQANNQLEHANRRIAQLETTIGNMRNMASKLQSLELDTDVIK